jgi:hypothetical protein
VAGTLAKFRRCQSESGYTDSILPSLIPSADFDIRIYLRQGKMLGAATKKGGRI